MEAKTDQEENVSAVRPLGKHVEGLVHFRLFWPLQVEKYEPGFPHLFLNHKHRRETI